MDVTQPERRHACDPPPSATPESHAHTLYLYDNPDALADMVARFVDDGLRHDGAVLVLASADTWSRVDARLDAMGTQAADRRHGGRLVFVDADALLATLAHHGRPDEGEFERHVAPIVARLSAGRPLRVFGEVVNLLAARGEFVGARRLEDYWNTLARRYPFTLLCGYDAVHFGDARHAGMLHAICHAHTGAEAQPGDMLANWILHGEHV